MVNLYKNSFITTKLLIKLDQIRFPKNTHLIVLCFNKNQFLIRKHQKFKQILCINIFTDLTEPKNSRTKFGFEFYYLILLLTRVSLVK